MAIAALYNIPGTPDETSEWSFAHMAHHHDLNRVIYQKFKIALPEYVLDPLNPKDMQQWLYQHQVMHQNQDAVLGIEGFDLLDVNWEDRDFVSNTGGIEGFSYESEILVKTILDKLNSEILRHKILKLSGFFT